MNIELIERRRRLATNRILAGFLIAVSAAILTGPLAARSMPAGTDHAFENVEGVIFVRAKLSGASRDTSGLLVLDTGAGFLGLDVAVARRLDLVDGGDGAPIAMLRQPLHRLELGDLAIDQVAPVLAIDLGVIRRVTGRPAIGLLGQRTFTHRALWIDYRAETLRVIPNPPAPRGDAGEAGRPSGPNVAEASPTSLATLDESRAIFGDRMKASAFAMPFRLLGDNKMIVTARAGSTAGGARTGTPLHLVFDTGATQCVLFEPDFTERVPDSRAWRSAEGMLAPTLVGDEPARLAIAPWFAVDVAGPDPRRSSMRRNVECAIVRTDLAATIAAAVGEPVHGLLGYAYLRNFNVGIDFTRNLVWMDPIRDRSIRPLEHTHIGVQLEADEDRIRIASVARGAPAAAAGIAAGDELVSIDGHPVRGGDVVEIAHRLEGRAGTQVRVVIRRGAAERDLRLTRKRIL